MGRNSDIQIDIESTLAYCLNDKGMTNDQAIDWIKIKFKEHGRYAVDHAESIIETSKFKAASICWANFTAGLTAPVVIS